MVLELCQCDLKQFSYEHKVTLEHCRQFSRQILHGLEYIHQNDIIHRDIKLENILLKDNVVKIGDFGIAVKNDHPDFESVLKFDIVGTWHYTAPELIRRQGVDFFSDVWSFGVAMYRFFYSKYPFIGEKKRIFMMQSLRGSSHFPRGEAKNLKNS